MQLNTRILRRMPRDRFDNCGRYSAAQHGHSYYPGTAPVIVAPAARYTPARTLAGGAA